MALSYSFWADQDAPRLRYVSLPIPPAGPREQAMKLAVKHTSATSRFALACHIYGVVSLLCTFRDLIHSSFLCRGAKLEPVRASAPRPKPLWQAFSTGNSLHYLRPG